MTSSPGWSARYAFVVTTLLSGDVVLLGGYAGANMNDVWLWSNPASGGVCDLYFGWVCGCMWVRVLCL